MNRRDFISTTVLSCAAIAASGAAASSKLRVAIIGHTGRGDYGHGLDTMWLRMPETQIVAVADANETGLANAKKKLKVDKGFADYRQMLGETKPDIVAICPRHVDQHRDMAIAAIESGVRGIYLEKPLCRTLAEADEIIAAADKRGVKIAIGHRGRYHPVLITIDEMLKAGAIGRLLEIRARGKEDKRGGALDLWVLGTHLLNLIHHLGGKPLACSATLLQNSHPATRADVREGDEGVGLIAGNEVHIRYEMEKGFQAFFDSVQNAGSKAFGLQLIGTQGIIAIRGDSEPWAYLIAGNPFEPPKQPRQWVPISSVGAGKPEQPNVADDVKFQVSGGRELVAAVRENRQPICNAAEGRTTIEMIMAAFESHRLNGQRVPLPLSKLKNPLTEL